MNTPEPTAPLLATRDPRLLDSLLSTALALGIDLAVVRQRDELRLRWRSASLRLVGPDLAPKAATLEELGATWAVGFTEQELLRASAELSCPALLLPQGASRLAEVLASSSPDHAGQVVALIGASGGVGVSSLVSALATRAAEQGLRAAAVELAACGGGLDLLFGAETQPGMTWDELSNAAGEVGDLGEHLVTVERVSVLSLGRGRSEQPDEAAITAVVRSMERSHDLVVIDLGDGDRLAALGRRALPLLVVAADVRAVAAARMRASQLNLVGALLVVRTGPGRRIPPSLVADAVGLPLAGTIRHDARVPRLAAQGASVGSKLASRLRADSRRLLEEVLR